MSRRAIGVFVAVFLISAVKSATGIEPNWSVRQDQGSTALSEHRFSEAENLFEQAASSAITPAQRVESLRALGTVQLLQDQNLRARATLSQAYRELSEAAPAHQRSLTAALLYTVCRKLADYESSEKFLRDALQKTERETSDYGMLSAKLADLLRELGRQEEAMFILEDALTGSDKASPWWIDLMLEKAQIYADLNKWGLCMELWREIRPEVEAGGRARQRAAYQAGLGSALFEQGNTAMARPLLEHAAAAMKDRTVFTPTQLAGTLAELGRLYLDENRLGDAENVLTEAIGLEETSLGPAHPQVGILLQLKAILLSRSGHSSEALVDIERSRRIMAASFGEDSPATGVVDSTLGLVEWNDHHLQAAISAFENAVRKLKAAPVAEGSRAALVAQYADALRAAHRGKEAAAILKAERVNGRPAPSRESALTVSAKSFTLH